MSKKSDYDYLLFKLSVDERREMLKKHFGLENVMEKLVNGLEVEKADLMVENGGCFGLPLGLHPPPRRKPGWCHGG